MASCSSTDVASGFGGGHREGGPEGDQNGQSFLDLSISTAGRRAREREREREACGRPGRGTFQQIGSHILSTSCEQRGDFSPEAVAGWG